MATTTNYGWTTPDDTALVKDGASAIRSLGTSVDTTTKNLNPSTTLGDIEYRSSTANTNTRLAVGSTGQVLTVAGGVPSWASPAGAGLNLIDEVSFSNSSTTNVNNVFSATYVNYRIIIRQQANGGSGGNTTMRLRVSGADSSTNYNTQEVYCQGTGTVTGRTNVFGTDEWFLGDFGANTQKNSPIIYDILAPYLAEATTGFGHNYVIQGNSVRYCGLSNSADTSYTGFTLLNSYGTDGVVSVYGYAKE